MRNWLAIAAVGIALAAAPAWAQMHGAHFGGARPGIGRAPVGQHGAFIPRSAPRFSSMTFSHRPFFGNGFHSRFFVGSGFRFHHGHRFFISSFGWPYGFYGYYPGYYPPLLSDTYDASNNAYAEQSYQLQQQVNQLSYEVQRLREEQTERSVPPPSPPQQSAPQSNAAPTSSTTLVFRDGKTEKTDNYAIAGSTLWVFTEQRARKISLSEVDIPATQKANEEQGVAFQVPPAR